MADEALRWRAMVVAVVVAVAGVCVACSDTDDGDATAAVAAERKAALAYGQAATGAKALQGAFLAAWKSAREVDTVADLRRLGKERVLPTLAAYVSALERMPVEGQRLKALHDPLLDAWHRFQGRLSAYYERVDDQNLPKRNARLQADWSELGARIVSYREQLVVLYGTLGLHLPGVAPSPDSATHESATHDSATHDSATRDGATRGAPGASGHEPDGTGTGAVNP